MYLNEYTGLAIRRALPVLPSRGARDPPGREQILAPYPK